MSISLSVQHDSGSIMLQTLWMFHWQKEAWIQPWKDQIPEANITKSYEEKK